MRRDSSRDPPDTCNHRAQVINNAIINLENRKICSDYFYSFYSLTFLIPIMLRGKSSSSCKTESTTILLKKSFCWWINFELRAVAAHFSRRRRFSSVDFSILTLHEFIVSIAKEIARRKDLMIILGWTPSSMKGFICFRNSPASRTTLVVPSPTCEWNNKKMKNSVEL